MHQLVFFTEARGCQYSHGIPILDNNELLLHIAIRALRRKYRINLMMFLTIIICENKWVRLSAMIDLLDENLLLYAYSNNTLTQCKTVHGGRLNP